MYDFRTIPLYLSANPSSQIIGAPSFFPTVWGWIKKWFDPITTSKIFILSDKDVYPTLSAFIEHESIPKKYGGGLDFVCGQLPLLDPPVRAALDLRGSEELFLTAPVRWVDDENGEMVALGVGSVDGHPRQECMATLHSLARLTLTRSNTHQGQVGQTYAETVYAPRQVPEVGTTNSTNRLLTPSSSRPQSRDQAQQAALAPSVAPAQSRPTPAPVVSTLPGHLTSMPTQPDGQYQSQQAPSMPDTIQTQAGPPRSLSAISSVTEQKPTLLSYRPDTQFTQAHKNPTDLQQAPHPSQHHVLSPMQPDPSTQATASPSQLAGPPNPSQPRAPLIDRLDPHFSEPHNDRAKTLPAESPHDQLVANGKPTNLALPERPATLDRTETVYMTPASDPSELRGQFS